MKTIRKSSYDAIVVGAGPGGSVAARVLAQAGYDVLLVEKRPQVGSPVRCGEAAGNRSELAVFLPVDDEWISSDIHGIRFVSPSGNVAERRIGDIGTVLDREKFDPALATHAVGAGVTLVTSIMVTDLIREGGRIAGARLRSTEGSGREEFEIRSRVVVGADGVESLVGRWAGLDRGFRLKDIHACAQYLLENTGKSDTLLEIHVGREAAPGGYAWVFPKEPNRANVGVGLHPSIVPGNRAMEYLDRFKARYFPDAVVKRTVVGGTTGSSGPGEIVGDGVVLVGEAARQNNPFSGGGIMNSMEGAQIAGEVMVDALRRDRVRASSMKEYRNRWMDHWGKVNERFHKLRKVFLALDDDDLDIAVEVMGEITGQLEIGAIDYVKVFADVLRHHPRLLLKARHYF